MHMQTDTKYKTKPRVEFMDLLSCKSYIFIRMECTKSNSWYRNNGELSAASIG